MSPSSRPPAQQSRQANEREEDSDAMKADPLNAADETSIDEWARETGTDAALVIQRLTEASNDERAEILGLLRSQLDDGRSDRAKTRVPNNADAPSAIEDGDQRLVWERPARRRVPDVPAGLLALESGHMISVQREGDSERMVPMPRGITTAAYVLKGFCEMVLSGAAPAYVAEAVSRSFEAATGKPIPEYPAWSLILVHLALEAKRHRIEQLRGSEERAPRPFTVFFDESMIVEESTKEDCTTLKVGTQTPGIVRMVKVSRESIRRGIPAQPTSGASDDETVKEIRRLAQPHTVYEPPTEEPGAPDSRAGRQGDGVVLVRLSPESFLDWHRARPALVLADLDALVPNASSVPNYVRFEALVDWVIEKVIFSPRGGGKTGTVSPFAMMTLLADPEQLVERICRHGSLDLADDVATAASPECMCIIQRHLSERKPASATKSSPITRNAGDVRSEFKSKESGAEEAHQQGFPRVTKNQG
jgi:hypothetical protein